MVNQKVKKTLFLAVVILIAILAVTSFFLWLFGPPIQIKISNLNMLHGLDKCNVDFDLVNEGDSDILVEVIFFEPHFTLDREKVIDKEEFYVPAHSIQNNTMSFFFSPCSQSYTEVRLNILQEE